MKIIRILLMLFLMSALLCKENGSALEMKIGFTTDNMDLEEQKRFLSNINLSLITEEPSKNAITCFDVNDSGLIAIGSKNSKTKLVLVYTTNGNFKYGYAFNCNGDFGVEWDGNNIIIYFVRSDVAALFDETGKSIDLKIIQDTIDNNCYWNHVVYSTKRTINGSQYIMRNNMGIFNIFAISYSQLIKTDSDAETIIYDVSNAYSVKFIIIFITIILFVGFVVSMLILQFVKLRKNNNIFHV